MNVILLLLLLFPPVLFANEALLAPVIDDDEYYSETFTVFADLKNGAYVYGQIGISNIGPGNRRGICRMLIVEADKASLDQSIIVDSDEWFFDHQPEQRLQVKNCKLTHSSNQESLEFFGIMDGVKISILLDRTPEKHQVPFNQIHTKSGYYLSDILVPWATASVNYEVAGQKVWASGYGYADHSRSTLLPAQIAHQWLRFRGLNGEHSLLFLARQAEAKTSFDGWVWSQMEEAASVLQSVALFETSHRHWHIDIRDDKVRYKIETETRLLRYAPLEDQGFLVKVLSYAIGNPVTYTYRAVLTLPDGKRIPGILEIARINGD